MKLLITAFKGKNNSSSELLNSINLDKLYFTNSYRKSEQELRTVINKYDYIVMLGKKAKAKKITIELCGRNFSENIKTNFPIENIINLFKKNKIEFLLSNNAGNYLCNNIYFFGLNYIKTNNLNTKIIFIHIPSKISNDLITKFDEIFKFLNNNL